MPAKCTYCPIFDFFECQVDSAFYQTSAGTKWSRWFSRWADVAEEFSDNNLISSKRHYHTILTWNMTSSCLLSTGNQAPPAVAALRLLFLHLCQPHAGEISQAGCEIYCFKFILFFFTENCQPYACKISQAGCEICCFQLNQLVDTKVNYLFSTSNVIKNETKPPKLENFVLKLWDHEARHTGPLEGSNI